jgi:hypothetical protein
LRSSSLPPRLPENQTRRSAPIIHRFHRNLLESGHLEIQEIKRVTGDSHLTHSFSQSPMNISVDNADNFGRKLPFLSTLPTPSFFQLRFSKTIDTIKSLSFRDLAQTSTFPATTAVASLFSASCF